MVKGKKWTPLYDSEDANFKANILQKTLMEKFYELFPLKTLKMSEDDQPWFTQDLKNLDRRRKREFRKNHKSEKWLGLNKLFLSAIHKAKVSYRNNIVDDLKTSQPGKWYSKIKRMSGLGDKSSCDIFVEEICDLSNQDQAKKIAEFYASPCNLFDPVNKNDFSDYLSDLNYESLSENLITPQQIEEIINKLNSKSATVLGDLPMKIINLFSRELSSPLCNVINTMLLTGIYPDMWKRELITPVPKCYPPPSISKLRPISGLFNFAKITDRILANFMINDMAPKSDQSQYGNQKGLSVNHYLINMINKILLSVESNSSSEKMSVILNMIDWSQAFERQSHKLGIKSFIRNGVRKSLIPLLISFFPRKIYNGQMEQ